MALGDLVAFGSGEFPRAQWGLDEHQARDRFLEILEVVEPALATKGPPTDVRRAMIEVFQATFEVDWAIGAPWLLEAAIDVLQSTRGHVYPSILEPVGS